MPMRRKIVSPITPVQTMLVFLSRPEEPSLWDTLRALPLVSVPDMTPHWEAFIIIQILTLVTLLPTLRKFAPQLPLPVYQVQVLLLLLFLTQPQFLPAPDTIQ